MMKWRGINRYTDRDFNCDNRLEGIAVRQGLVITSYYRIIDGCMVWLINRFTVIDGFC